MISEQQIIIGESQSFLEVIEQTSHAASHDRPVLVIGERGTGTFATTVMLMRAFGLSGTDLARQFNLSADEAARALCENRIDAMVFVVGHPSRTVREVSESCAVRFASIAGEPVARILRDYPYFSRASISPNMYIGQEKSIQSLGVRASVMTTSDLPDERMLTEVGPALRDGGGVSAWQIEHLRMNCRSPLPISSGGRRKLWSVAPAGS